MYEPVSVRAIYVEVLSSGSNRREVDVLFNTYELKFEEHVYSLSAVKLEVGGSRDHLLFIHFSEEKSIYIELSKENIQKLCEINYFKVFLQKKQHKLAAIFSLDMSLIILFFVFIFTLINFRSEIAGQISKLVPISVEQKISDQFYQFDKKDQLPQTVAIESKMAELAEEINEFNENKKFYKIHLRSDSEMNAYASFGGHIFINRGLLLRLNSAEQFLGVLAHEMIHAKDRHVLKNIFQSATLFIVIQAMMGDITGLIAILGDAGGPLLNLSYSRELESFADEKAVEMLLKSNVNPLGLSDSLKLIEVEMKDKIKETAGGEVLEKVMQYNFLRSHPVTQDRSKQIQDLIDQWNLNPDNKKKMFKNLDSKWLLLKKELEYGS